MGKIKKFIVASPEIGNPNNFNGQNTVFVWIPKSNIMLRSFYAAAELGSLGVAGMTVQSILRVKGVQGGDNYQLNDQPDGDITYIPGGGGISSGPGIQFMFFFDAGSTKIPYDVELIAGNAYRFELLAVGTPGPAVQFHSSMVIEYEENY